mmetsp:Transcript_1672/g.3748  ORF Transcript_1672/g.3748 Transcript_1672/m.3748 type:complete len:225 (-) Transcript_1672:574-1248(-)
MTRGPSAPIAGSVISTFESDCPLLGLILGKLTGVASDGSGTLVTLSSPSKSGAAAGSAAGNDSMTAAAATAATAAAAAAAFGFLRRTSSMASLTCSTSALDSLYLCCSSTNLPTSSPSARGMKKLKLSTRRRRSGRLSPLCSRTTVSTTMMTRRRQRCTRMRHSATERSFDGARLRRSRGFPASLLISGAELCSCLAARTSGRPPTPALERRSTRGRCTRGGRS